MGTLGCQDLKGPEKSKRKCQPWVAIVGGRARGGEGELGLVVRRGMDGSGGKDSSKRGERRVGGKNKSLKQR